MVKAQRAVSADTLAQPATERSEEGAQESNRGAALADRVQRAGFVIQSSALHRNGDGVDGEGAGGVTAPVAALAADAAEERGRAERERGIGDVHKAQKMAKRSADREKASAEASKKG